jgi:hypothetical protein
MRDLSSSGRKKPLWIQSSNFVALLNLPKAMQRFGPPRELWEGGPRGEGILRELKPLIRGLRGNWTGNALRRFYENRALDDIWPQDNTFPDENVGYTDEESDDEYNEDEPPAMTVDVVGGYTKQQRYRPFRYYANKDIAFQAFEKSMPLSILQLFDGKFGFVTKAREFVTLERQNFSEELCGASYFEWSCNRVQEGMEESEWVTKIRHHCLFLPRLAGDGKPQSGQSSYYVITSKWLEMKKDGSIGLPGVQNSASTYIA